MRISEFAVRNQRAVRLASCSAVPKVMIITGPNGSGKSTLLNHLRTLGTGPGRTLYVGPHRTSRRQQVRMRFLTQQRIQMGTLLASPHLPGMEGIATSTNERDAWNYDETQSYLKYSLCQIELDRQRAIAERFDEIGTISKKDMPDVWQPLSEMTHNLLPHLKFHKIDISNRDQVRCLWQVHTKDVLVDIDDLSSGEKSLIQLFFPLIEHQIESHLESISGKQPPEPTESSTVLGPVAVLMDEPELHLHPHLQAKVLDYIRSVSLSENVQFLLATHSPAIVEHSTSDELYLLRPAELTGGDENQLVQIATSEERLSLVRETFGSTSNITAMRKIVVVEGASAGAESRRAADARIYNFLSERFSQVNIISGGGKFEVTALTQRLNEALATIAPGISAKALLDRDLESSATGPDGAILLPVSMIENLLIDPDVLWNAIELVRHKTAFQGSTEIANAIDEILEQLELGEIVRRVKSSIPAKTFRLSEPLNAASQQIDTFVAMLRAELSDERLATLQDKAKNAVSQLKTEMRRREFFDGKRILDEFYKRHLHATGLSREVFIYSCARQASKRKSVLEFERMVFGALGLTNASNDA